MIVYDGRVCHDCNGVSVCHDCNDVSRSLLVMCYMIVCVQWTTQSLRSLDQRDGGAAVIGVSYRLWRSLRRCIDRHEDLPAALFSFYDIVVDGRSERVTPLHGITQVV